MRFLLEFIKYNRTSIQYEQVYLDLKQDTEICSGLSI